MMTKEILSVREIQAQDIPSLVHYWMSATPEFLTGMGVDLAKMPTEAFFTNMLEEQIRQTPKEKQSYCIIWLADGKAIGHSNINKITWAEEASMHLHIWDAATRKKGFGQELIRMTLPFFFRTYELKKVYSEPYALNPAPNKTLEKAGFTFVKKYMTTPGWINFEQEVNRWEMTREQFEALR